MQKHWCVCARTPFPIFRKHWCAYARACAPKNVRAHVTNPARICALVQSSERIGVRAHAHILKSSECIGELARVCVLLKMRAHACNKSCAHMCACPNIRKHWCAYAHVSALINSRAHVPNHARIFACASTHFPIFRKHWYVCART
jgi:hypothetical protein